jgi:phage terminase large subunit-like protein
MVLQPPGSAKSTYANVQFIPHALAQREGQNVLACSHSTELAESFGGRARNLIEVNGKLLGLELCAHSRSRGRWEVGNKGTYLAAGVGTAIAGFRADIGLIDDPIRNREDADSKLVRDNHWDWYNFDFKTRLKPNAVIVFIYTPWHEDDLGHRILAAEGEVKNGGDWEVLRLPFFAEEGDPLGRDPHVENGTVKLKGEPVELPKGEMLWPQWYKKEMYPLDKRVGAALYQLRPSPEGGDYFKREWIEPCEYHTAAEIPQDLRIYVGSDHALGTREHNDRNCLIPVGVDSKDNIWILPDVWWKRADSGELVDAIIEMGRRRKPIEWWAESEHIEKSLRPFINKRMEETKTWFVITPLTSSRDLVSRAQPIRGKMRSLKVRFPAFTHWWHEAKHELLSFSGTGKSSTHDDFIAALSEIGRGLDLMSRPQEPVSEEDVLAKLGQETFKPSLKWLKEMDRLANKKQSADRYGDR